MNQLSHEILLMGTRVEEDLRKTIQACRDRDTELARAVRAGDRDINTMQAEIEDKAAVLLATQQPVAGDLRKLVTFIKVVSDLERIGDYTSHLAKTVMKVGDRNKEEEILRSLTAMADKGCVMLSQAMAALLGNDEDLARSTAAMDTEIDTMHKNVMSDIMEAMRLVPKNVEIEARLMRTANFLERLGDHVTNICESVIYMVSGVHVEMNE
jgi:phosphate transport system protein